MHTLVAVSLLADNAAPFYRQLLVALGQRLGMETRLLAEDDWSVRRAALLSGEATLGFLCGLPYTALTDEARPPVALLAAPVMAAPRYAGQPVYFSDVVVPAASPAQSFDDLRGARWAYNEAASFSGYLVVQDFLAAQGYTRGYFGSAEALGSHQDALAAVVAGRADGAAIDSIVLAYELAQRPELAQQIRTVATIGPSPVPPVIASTRLAPAERARLAEALLTLDQTAAGRAALERGQLARFMAVRDKDYDPIRRAARTAAQIPLVESAQAP